MQSVIPFPEPSLPIDTAVFCAAQAEAIRVLGRRVARDVVEIGERLGAVQRRLVKQKGAFPTWLEDEFHWNYGTAHKYIRIAASWSQAFNSSRDEELVIEVEALYLLSHQQVPGETREKAVERAIEGEHITLAAAKEMIAGEVADKIAEMRRDERRRRDQAVAAATAALRDELDELRAAEQEPTVEDAIGMMQRISGKKQLTRMQMQAVAMLTGYAVPYKGTMIPPTSPENQRVAEFHLEVTSNFIRAIQFFGQTPLSVEELFAASRPFQRSIARMAIPIALKWLGAYADLLTGEEGEQ
jgi:hypothetical protein